MTRAARLALALVLGILAPACQTASIEQATTSFVPPPRTVDDIIGALNEGGFIDPSAARARADERPSPTVDAAALAEFYFTRGLAAGAIGRAKQEIEDLTRASEYARQTVSPDYAILYSLALAHRRGGNFFRHVHYLHKSVESVPVQAGRDPLLVVPYTMLAFAYASIGDLRASEAALAETSRRFYEVSQSARGAWELFIQGQATLLGLTGRHAEAEALCRKVIALLAADRQRARSPWFDEEHGFLSRVLVQQGRLLEAENAARTAVRGALANSGRYSPHTAWMLRSLVWVLLEQDRAGEAEALARTVIDIFEKTGTAPDSLRLAFARQDVARALEVQGRDQQSLREYEVIRAGLARDPSSLDTFFTGNVEYAELMLKTGSADRALEILGVALERSKGLVGEAHRDTAAIRGLLARAWVAKGDAARALREFREAVPVLLARAPDVDDESPRPAAAQRRLAVTLTSYIGLLGDIRDTPLEREARLDAMAEAFRLADVARGRSVQRALGASAARAAARSPELAEVVRAQQDAKKRIGALYGELADLVSMPGQPPDPALVSGLRRRIDDLRRSVRTLTARIETEFPAYAELVDPKPVTLDEARARLRPGEALIATFVSQDRAFVWAVPERGPVAFAVRPTGARELEGMVTTLRAALEPRAETLGDIPDFDLALAHRLFKTILEPVRPGWQDARSLLVVAHGPLAQLPLALLPTTPVTLPARSGVIFSSYREVDWLVRTHAVTMLPSVSSLATLLSLPPGNPSRHAFVGFGDPYFSVEQATSAAAAQATLTAPSVSQPPEAVALSTRAVPVTFRRAQLGRLPRLPETAAEIRALAAATNADPSRDVFLGAHANETNVKTLDLAGYRVIAFATHGLVPGDLDGLTQPALALSAPQVAGVEGDGFLTMDEIMALRLNADWIVLSACNTASARGAGAEAVSGLGRAFFYAGVRALLVSNWPVETTSALALTTDLFRRQQASPGVSRALALQQTLNWLIDRGELVDEESGRVVFSYAHPIFWAPFTLIGDGGGDAAR